jgi:hypothetical protein
MVVARTRFSVEAKRERQQNEEDDDAAHALTHNQGNEGSSRMPESRWPIVVLLGPLDRLSAADRPAISKWRVDSERYARRPQQRKGEVLEERQCRRGNRPLARTPSKVQAAIAGGKAWRPYERRMDMRCTVARLNVAGNVDITEQNPSLVADLVIVMAMLMSDLVAENVDNARMITMGNVGGVACRRARQHDNGGHELA